MPPQITCASALPGKTENTKIAFSLKCCISVLLEFNKLLDFFNLFESQLILTLLYDRCPDESFRIRILTNFPVRGRFFKKR